MIIALCVLYALAFFGLTSFVLNIIVKLKQKFREIEERQKLIEQEYLSLYKDFKKRKGDKNVLPG